MVLLHITITWDKALHITWTSPSYLGFLTHTEAYPFSPPPRSPNMKIDMMFRKWNFVFYIGLNLFIDYGEARHIKLNSSTSVESDRTLRSRSHLVQGWYSGRWLTHADLLWENIVTSRAHEQLYDLVIPCVCYFDPIMSLFAVRDTLAIYIYILNMHTIQWLPT